MHWVRGSISDYGKLLIVHRNASGQTLLRGCPVVLYTGSGMDGVKVTLPTIARETALFIGVAHADALDGAYFKVQVGGYCDYALMANHGSDATLIGDAIAPVVNQQYLQRTSSSDPGFRVLARSLEAVVASVAIYPVARKILLGGPGC